MLYVNTYVKAWLKAMKKLFSIMSDLQTPYHEITSVWVHFMFQFVSTAAAAAAETFAPHVKTVWAKPYISGTKKVKVWENVLNDLSMTLTKGMRTFLRALASG